MLFPRNRKSKRRNSELEYENRQLELQMMGIADQLENFKKISFKYQAEYNKLAKKVKSFCYSLLNHEYAKNQLGKGDMIQDMDIFQLLDYTEQKYRENQARERGFLSTLADQLNKKEQEIESLKIQLSRLISKEQHMQKYSEERIDNNTSIEQNEEIKNIEDIPEEKPRRKEEPEKEIAQAKSPVSKAGGGVVRMSIIEGNDAISEPIKTEAQKEDRRSPKRNEDNKHGRQQNRQYKNIPRYLEKENLNTPKSSATIPTQASSNHRQRQSSEKKNQAPEAIKNIKKQVQKQSESKDGARIKAHVVDLNDYVNKMTDIMWDVMLAIGKEGLSESKDIKRVVMKKGTTESAFNTALTQLRKMNVIKQERINTGWRWFHSYELSEIGSRIFLEKYKKNPVECEKQLLKKQHTSALHGYCIKDTAEILKAVFGYDETTTDRRQNSMRLYSGETYIPDVIAKKKEGALIDYFEVELGHHTQEDFNKKCDKMLMVTKNLYFVVPDADTMNKTLARQIGQWVLERGGKDKLKGTTIYLTTLKKLNDGKWENIYPF